MQLLENRNMGRRRVPLRVLRLLDSTVQDADGLLRSPRFHQWLHVYRSGSVASVTAGGGGAARRHGARLAAHGPTDNCRTMEVGRGKKRGSIEEEGGCRRREEGSGRGS